VGEKEALDARCFGIKVNSAFGNNKTVVCSRFEQIMGDGKYEREAKKELFIPITNS